MSDFLSGFDDWTAGFEGWTDVSIHELHGLMTAIVCACKPPKADEWRLLLSELSFSELPESAMELLTEYGEDVCFALKDKDDAYEYAPLLPDDEHGLSERLLALKEWASGFLTGVGVTDAHLQDDEKELLADLAKIAGLRGLEQYEDGNEKRSNDDGLEGEADAVLMQNSESTEEMYLQLFEFARLVPMRLAMRQKKELTKLAIIKGLAPDRKTAKELVLPLVVDVMS